MKKSCPLSVIDIDEFPGTSEAIDRHLIEVDETTCAANVLDDKPCLHKMTPVSEKGPPKIVIECFAPVIITLG
jgi:hypothetical protein